MGAISQADLKEILEKHGKWCREEAGGQRAYLQGASLQGADLTDTIMAGINWLSYIGIIAANGKAHAYKMTTDKGLSPITDHAPVDYLKEIEVTADLDKDTNETCGAGINLATFQWCLSNRQDKDWRLFIYEFDVTPENVCCPITSDGKFRVAKARRVCEVDWQGNIKGTEIK